MAQKKIAVELTKTQLAHVKKAIADAQYLHGLNVGRFNPYLTQASKQIEKAEGGGGGDGA